MTNDHNSNDWQNVNWSKIVEPFLVNIRNKDNLLGIVWVWTAKAQSLKLKLRFSGHLERCKLPGRVGEEVGIITIMQSIEARVHVWLDRRSTKLEVMVRVRIPGRANVWKVSRTPIGTWKKRGTDSNSSTQIRKPRTPTVAKISGILSSCLLQSQTGWSPERCPVLRSSA